MWMVIWLHSLGYTNIVNQKLQKDIARDKKSQLKGTSLVPLSRVDDKPKTKENIEKEIIIVLV